MAATQAAEIIFAQKLASNEKPVRSKALLKLRKYISVRSGRTEGGFSEEELLKVWKGLFYCLWMQDLPLLQEELSRKISGLLHSFRSVDSQLLYFQTFLQTMKREWNGIDRLRMDKFYQLVRFVFRELFEMLKSHEWESSLLSRFLALFSDQLLQGSSGAPVGLVLHILDLYMTELAAVGAAELTADQNLTFIEPFCRTMAKTKNRVLLKAVGSTIFSSIVDQVPLAIADLLREIGESEGTDPEDERPTSQKNTDSEEDGDQDEDLHPEDLQPKADGSCEAVLQFDYGAVADRLFDVASRSHISTFNRSKIYKFVKIFRDLSEGVFPQDEVEVVSSDEDEDEDDDRRRKKRKKQKQQESLQRSRGQSSEDTERSEETQKKKRKRKKRKNRGVKSAEEEQTPGEPSETPQDSEKSTETAGDEPEKPLKKRQGRKNGNTTPEDTQASQNEETQQLTSSPADQEPDDTPERDTQPDASQPERSLHTDHTSAAEGQTTVEEDGDTRRTVLRKRRKKSTDQPNGDAHPEEQSLLTGAKKRKQKPTAEPSRPVRKRRAKEDVKPLNGHETTDADPSPPAGAELKMRKKFVLRQRKAPAPLFCKGRRSQRLQISPASKKVTFGLKNNKTMEFRKMDRSSLVSPVSQARVAFDPKRTPKSGVLKSPSSSPAVTRRASAADFF